MFIDSNVYGFDNVSSTSTEGCLNSILSRENRLYNAPESFDAVKKVL